MAGIISKTEYKNIFKIFFAWQERKEEEWLRKMSNEGWHLNRAGFLNYEFVKGEPKDIIYRLDYKPFRNEKIDDYITLFEDSGWEYVSKFAGWFYFRTEAKDNLNVELYNDNASKIRKYKTLRWVLIIACAPLILVITLSTPLTFFLVLVLALLIYGIIRISMIMRRIRSDIRE